MSEPSGGIGLREWSMALLRVGLTLAIWLALFLLTFIGYLTLPIALVAAFLVVYGLADQRRLRRLRRRLGASRSTSPGRTPWRP